MKRTTQHDTNPNTTHRAADLGQATSEYALVMLAAALIALLAVGWASSGDGSGKIGQMFDRVLENVSGRIP